MTTLDPNADLPPREPSFKNPRTVGMILFLTALGVLFAASLVLYALMRTRAAGKVEPVQKVVSVPWGSLSFPVELVVSTVLVVGVSVALAVASRQIRSGRHRSYRNSLTAALALAAGFLTVQTPAMVALLKGHWNQLQGKGTHLYGLIFFLVLVHALHVLGGMVSLVRVTVKARRGAYDRVPPDHDPIRMTTMYWHFLDVVWIVMFAMLFLMR